MAQPNPSIVTKETAQDDFPNSETNITVPLQINENCGLLVEREINSGTQVEFEFNGPISSDQITVTFTEQTPFEDHSLSFQVSSGQPIQKTTRTGIDNQQFPFKVQYASPSLSVQTITGLLITVSSDGNLTNPKYVFEANRNLTASYFFSIFAQTHQRLCLNVTNNSPNDKTLNITGPNYAKNLPVDRNRSNSILTPTPIPNPIVINFRENSQNGGTEEVHILIEPG